MPAFLPHRSFYLPGPGSGNQPGADMVLLLLLRPACRAAVTVATSNGASLAAHAAV